VKKGYDKDEMLIASCAQHMLSLLDSSPDFATLYYQMAKLDANKKEQVRLLYPLPTALRGLSVTVC
jgi:hypothetical protein